MLILRRHGINKLLICRVTSWLLDPQLLNCWSTLATWVDHFWSPTLINSLSTRWIPKSNMLINSWPTCWFYSTSWSTSSQILINMPFMISHVDHQLINLLISTPQTTCWSTVDRRVDSRCNNVDQQLINFVLTQKLSPLPLAEIRLDQIGLKISRISPSP